MVIITVAASKEKIVKIGDGFLNSLGLEILESVDKLEQDEAHVLFKFVNT